MEKASCIHPFCFRKSVYRKTGGWWDRTLHHGLGEDADLFLKLIEHTDIHEIPEVIHEYRVHPSGMTKVVDEAHILEGVRTCAEEAARRRGFDWEVTAENVFSVYRKLTEWRAPGVPVRIVVEEGAEAGRPNWIARLFRRP